MMLLCLKLGHVTVHAALEKESAIPISVDFSA
jgi:hypothetical protein